MADNGADDGADDGANDGANGGGGSAGADLPPLHHLNLDNLPKGDAHLLKENNPWSDFLKDGVYCLDRYMWENLQSGDSVAKMLGACDSSIILVRGAFTDHNLDRPYNLKGLITNMAEFMSNPSKVPPSKGMFGVEVGRRQCTFGAKYKGFGAAHQLDESAPLLVRKVFEHTQQILKASPELAQSKDNIAKYTGVHCNWYENTKANVPAHRDDETDMVPGLPIFSYTFLRKRDEEIDPDKPPVPREFRIYNRKPTGPRRGAKGEKVASVWLNQGDLLIMAGAMQTHFYHEVPKTADKRYNNTQRINMTVRAFTDAAVAAGASQPAA